MVAHSDRGPSTGSRGVKPLRSAGDRPSRRPFPELVDFESVVEERGYQPAQLSELLYEFSDFRERALYLLYNLSDRQWRRVGQHRYRGDLTIDQLVRVMNEHDLAHLWQGVRLKQEMP